MSRQEQEEFFTVQNQSYKRQRVATGICQAIQDWLDANRKEFGGARVIVDAVTFDGSVAVTIEGKFGQGSWRRMVSHWRNGGLEELRPHLRRMGAEWIHPRIANRYSQSSPVRRCFRIKPDMRRIA